MRKQIAKSSLLLKKIKLYIQLSTKPIDNDKVNYAKVDYGRGQVLSDQALVSSGSLPESSLI